MSLAYAEEMKEFIKCVQEGRKPDIDVHDGTAATVVSAAAQKALETGEIVRL